MRKTAKHLLPLFLLLCIVLSGCQLQLDNLPAGVTNSSDGTWPVSLSDIPDYTVEPFAVVNDNVPQFPEEDLNTEVFEVYSELDSLGRCGTAYANICKELMPTEKRESISSVKPSGWKSVQYDFVDGKSLYNRCHLIGFQLAGENANERNLITGTRYLNVEGMLPFENLIADYVNETNNHVLYRVTPIYEGKELVARGVQMEAYSIEDKGESISFNVFCYNVQPGVSIDYATGDNWADTDSLNVTEAEDYVLNVNNKKFHRPDCQSVTDMNPKNRQDYNGSRDLLIAQGYAPCGRCNP